MLAFALTPLSTWAAYNTPVVIKNSGSPDGRKDIVVVANDEDTGIAAGTAKIRDVKTGKVLGSFAWSGFGYGGGNPGAEAFEVLWRPDSRCFAIKWELTRGFGTCAVYAQSRGGWSQVSLPDFGKAGLKLARAAGEAHVAIEENWGGKGWENPSAWLPGNRLRVETAYRGILPLDVNGEWYQIFWFTLEISNPSGKAKPRAILKDARLAPLSVYHQPN